MRLYSYWRSSCSYRVRIALEYKGLSYETVPVHLVRDGGQQLQAEHLARNPHGQVPVLELADGTLLSQSLPIIEYLDEVWPERPLLPRPPEARAQARRLAEIVNSGIQPLQNLRVLKRLKQQGVDPVAWSREVIGEGLQALAVAAEASRGRFLVGDQPSLADVCLVPQLFNARRFDVDLSALPLLLEVEAVCAELPGFQQAHPDLQPDAEPASP